MDTNIIWLAKLLLAHFISDFALQRDSWIHSRNGLRVRSPYLYVHVAITGVVAMLAIGPAYWQVLLTIVVSHYLIDLWKSYAQPGLKNFLLDQAAHVLVIVLCWAVQFNLLPNADALHELYTSSHLWLFVAGAFFLTYPSSIIIDQAVSKWQPKVDPLIGLPNAGKYIGMIERLILCVLVYLGQYEAIGLLITGKSILRYNSKNEELKTEYLLMGTLLSLSLAFFVGLLLKQVVQGT